MGAGRRSVCFEAVDEWAGRALPVTVCTKNTFVHFQRAAPRRRGTCTGFAARRGSWDEADVGRRAARGVGRAVTCKPHVAGDGSVVVRIPSLRRQSSASALSDPLSPCSTCCSPTSPLTLCLETPTCIVRCAAAAQAPVTPFPYGMHPNFQGYASPGNFQGCASPANLQGYASPANFQACASPANLQGYASPANFQACTSPGNFQACASPANIQSYASPANFPCCASPANLQGCASLGNFQGYASPTNFQGCASPGNLQGYASPTNFQGCASPGSFLAAPGNFRASPVASPAATPPSSPPFAPQASPRGGNFELSPGVTLDALAKQLAAPLPRGGPELFPAVWQPLEVDSEPEPKKRSRRAKVVPPAAPHELTVMLRHLPLDLTPDSLQAKFEEFCPFVDFYYLPTNFETKKNLGYAFINFCDRAAAVRFTAFWEQSGVPESDDSPVQEARVQGFAANVERFRSSSVMAVLANDLKPRIFGAGRRLAFPAPDRQLPAVGPRFKPTDDSAPGARAVKVPLRRPPCLSTAGWPQL